jgi:uncharacterized coiled-coil protein SlyX
MNEMERLGARIDELEARLTFQDETIETLNRTITDQWLKLDRLTRQISELTERLREAEDKSPGPVNEVPPHY